MHLDHLGRAALSFALLGLACIEPPQTAPEQAQVPPPAVEGAEQGSAEQLEAEQGPRPPMSSGRLWANVQGVGVYVLDAQGWRELHSSRRQVADMVQVDGALLLLSSFGVSRLEHSGQVTPLAALDKEGYGHLGAPRALAVHAGEPWVLGAASLGHWRDAWSFAPLSEGSAPTQLAVDAEGRAWLGGAKLWRLESEASELAPVELTESSVAPVMLAAAPDGRVVALHGCAEASDAAFSCQLLSLGSEGSPPPPRALSLPCRPTRMALGPAPSSVVIASACGLITADISGAQIEATVMRSGWDEQQPLALAVDASGRRWLGTHEGLRLVDVRGVSFDFPLAQLGPMAGAVTQVLVEGEGPTPPELGLPRHGGLKGTLVAPGDRSPLAGAKVQLCTRLAPVPRPETSPCARVGVGLETTTDAEGHFELPNVPLAHYLVGVEVDGRWSLLSAKLLIMRQSMTANVGRLELPDL